MTSSEWVRATNALTALRQVGNAMAKSAQDIVAQLTMAGAVMDRTESWLAEAEPSASADRPENDRAWPAQSQPEAILRAEVEYTHQLITRIILQLDADDVLKRYMGADWVKEAWAVAHMVPEAHPPTAPQRPAQGTEWQDPEWREPRPSAEQLRWGAAAEAAERERKAQL